MTDQRRNDRVLLACLGLVAAMGALSFASVPLYDLFCRVTGFGGTTQVAARASGDVRERSVRIRFDSNVGPGLPWDFRPDQRGMDLRIGETGLTFFRAVNESGRTLVGTASYNVTPLKAGQYFNKIECFCFQEQRLKPGESAEFPVLFFVDPAMADDPNLAEVAEITLSYTFFEAEGQAAAAALTDGN